MEAAGQIVAGISLPLVHGSELLKAITIPLFTRAIGYVINWTGVKMLFYPVRFAGFRLPGLAPMVTLLPRKVQQIPGFMHGAVGWHHVQAGRPRRRRADHAPRASRPVGGPAAAGP